MIPSVFKWTKKNGSGDINNRKEATFCPEYKARSSDTDISVVIDKLNTSRIEEEEATDTASEGERDEVVGRPSSDSRKAQTSSEHCYEQPGEKSLEVEQKFSRPVLLCRHRFSVNHIISKCTTDKKERKYFNHFIGFNSCLDFKNSLLFLLPGLDRRQITYWRTKLAQESHINTDKLFDSDKEETDESDSENPSESDIPSNRTTRPDAHSLSCEDEYFLVLMRF